MTSKTKIDTRIYDFLDNGSLSIVNYTPFATSPDTIAPVTPPMNVIKTDLGGGNIKITWNANTEIDLSEYKIYWGAPTGYSFANSLNAGNVYTYSSLEFQLPIPSLLRLMTTWWMVQTINWMGTKVGLRILLANQILISQLRPFRSVQVILYILLIILPILNLYKYFLVLVFPRKYARCFKC